MHQKAAQQIEGQKAQYTYWWPRSRPFTSDMHATQFGKALVQWQSRLSSRTGIKYCSFF